MEQRSKQVWLFLPPGICCVLTIKCHHLHCFVVYIMSLMCGILFSVTASTVSCQSSVNPVVSLVLAPYIYTPSRAVFVLSRSACV